MANLTTAFDALLKSREAAPTKPFGPDTADEFLKEAYRIVRSPSPVLLSCLFLGRAQLTRPARTPSLRVCTPSCAASARLTSPPLLRGRRTFAPQHPARRPRSMATSRTATARRSTRTRKRRSATSTPASVRSKMPSSCDKVPKQRSSANGCRAVLVFWGRGQPGEVRPASRPASRLPLASLARTGRASSGS